MTQILKQSTAVDVLIGPFVDSGDGYTAETGVSPSVKLSKNGQTLAAKNDATTPVHDADGYYNCELDATDTDTIGTLILTVVGSATSLPVRHEFQVIDGTVYNALFGSSGTFITSQDIGLLYESTIGTVSTQTTFIMDDSISFDDGWDLNVCTVEDVSTGHIHTTYVNNVTSSTDTIGIPSAPDFTVVAGDKVRVYAIQHSVGAMSFYDPPTRAEATSDTNSILAKLLAYVQLLARSDSAIATDNSTALNEINTDEGSGAGAFDNTTDSLQKIEDDAQTIDTVVDAVKAKTDQLNFGVANTVDANITNVAGGSDLTAGGTGGQGYGES